MIIIESVPQVFGYLVPSATFTSMVGPGAASFLIILQLCLGSYIVFLMDEVVSKWGIGSGISLFIAAGVSEAIFTGMFNWNVIDSSLAISASNPPSGTIPKTIYILATESASELAAGGYEMIFVHSA